MVNNFYGFFSHCDFAWSPLKALIPKYFFSSHCLEYTAELICIFSIFLSFWFYRHTYGKTVRWMNQFDIICSTTSLQAALQGSFRGKNRFRQISDCENPVQRELRSAKNYFEKKSARQNFFWWKFYSPKFPFDEIPFGKNSLHPIGYRQTHN